MALIASPRHTREDLRVWEEREQMDRSLAEVIGGRLERLVKQAANAIVSFAVEPCYLGISWGKDSLVVAHIVARLPPLPIKCVYFVHGMRANPDCPFVRDAFFAQHRLDYLEHQVDPRKPDDMTSKAKRYERWVREAGLPPRRITGLRGAESRTRALSAAAHGVETETTCRPILGWSTAEVFAYLCQQGLPVHPAYAQSMGGALDRDWLRVAPLGGHEGAGHGRAEWERRYYGAELRRVGL